MPKKRVRSLRCPVCRKIVLRTDPEFPFCSERCRTIDLGRWLGESYSLPVMPDPDADELPEQPPASNGTEANGEQD